MLNRLQRFFKSRRSVNKFRKAVDVCSRHFLSDPDLVINGFEGVWRSSDETVKPFQVLFIRVDDLPESHVAALNILIRPGIVGTRLDQDQDCDHDQF